MKTYIGTKELLAKSMNRQEYIDYRGWTLPSDENGSDEGYLVEYLDGGRSNHKDHKDHISWSPADVFERAYKASGELPFGAAIMAAKKGKRIARIGWNGSNQYVYLVPEGHYKPQTKAAMVEFEGKDVPYAPYWVLKTVHGNIATWAPSCSDSLAEDWVIVDD